VLIPMAGSGSRFSSYGFTTPKHLLPVRGGTMIEMAVETLNAPPATTYTFVTRERVNVLDKYAPSWVVLDSITEGPACTVFAGLHTVPEDTPLLVSNSDQILENWDCSKFLRIASEYDGAVLTYTPNYPLQLGGVDKHSFVESNEQGECIRFAEKVVISTNALVGVHYFRNKKVFATAYDEMVRANARAPNGEFYLSLVYNFIPKSIAIPLSPGELFHPTGEPADYFTYNNTHGFGPVLIGKESLPYVSFSKGELSLTFRGTEVWIVHPSLAGLTLGDLSTYTRGWIIGDFVPSLFRTSEFEVGLLEHKKGEAWGYHTHDRLTEYNYLVEGSMVLNDIHLCTGSAFRLDKEVPAVPHFETDCYILCIKIPSVPGDKRAL